MKLVVKTLHGGGELVVSDNPLGKGGEGSVYPVLSHSVNSLKPSSEIVAKIYHDKNDTTRRDKVKTMIINSPETASAAWPLGVVYENDVFVGYIMKKLDKVSYRQWGELSNTKDRRQTSPEFDFRYAVAASRNLAAAINSIHKAGHKIGDINESNIFVKTDASVLIVDTDSAQIQSKAGKIFPCLVGKPEYTAPEISHGKLKDNVRTLETDVFAFAVAVFQMLTGGAHPTDGIYTGSDDPPTTINKIRAGIYPTLDNNLKNFETASRIPSECIPKAIRSFLLAALNPDPSQRPTLPIFIETVDEVLANLEQCEKVPTHWFDVRDGACLWCARGELSDPWGPPKNISQTVLPSVSFNSSNIKPNVRRAPPRVSGSRSIPQKSSSARPPTRTQSAPPSPLVPPPYQPPPTTPVYRQTVSSSSSFSQEQVDPDLPPSKIKGKTVLVFKDGSYGVRPSLRVLFRSNPKLAFSCIKNETPGFAKFWWSSDRPLPQVWALVIGFVLSTILSLSWQKLLPLTIPKLQELLPQIDILPEIIVLIGQTAVLTSLFTVIILLLSSLLTLRRSSKQYGSLSFFKRDKPLLTVLRFFPLPLIYGPLLMIFLIILFIITVLSIALNILTSGVNSRKRY